MPTIEVLMNPHHQPNQHKRKDLEATYPLPTNFDQVYAFHQSMKEYTQTSLHDLKCLAHQLKVQKIYVKDESQRFGINAFKGLGVSFALNEIIKKDPEAHYTFVSCTDGNHGKALAWRADSLGHKAIIFMPKGSDTRRVKAIEAYHAKVVVTDMNYDDTVRYASEYAKEHGCYLVQDTSLPHYTEIPNNIVLGYSTMVCEALEQMSEKPTHVFLQAGVGSMAGGVLWYLCHHYAHQLPFIGVIESSQVACIYESVQADKMISIGGEPYTLMAGLNCGEANFMTFPLLKEKSNGFIKCQDEITLKGMSRSQHPIQEDPVINAGESGAVGLGFIEEILTNPDYLRLKTSLKLDADSVILLFNTEGMLE
ncbi:diaminopropionate ammonia-lyase [Tindallia magadiensis]|uniref:Diaminopropionate ammonia-lyase n=1 Tax=Tindallia magadiensis TaxID=69895 RepID=A0A1I3EX14_9FIRM|nr:diaminopropionate ammonia-lyase [Tindallia magadiensis]SFI03462.1 diaminopropionate ammonia-lyase [Tindallia magadiensis]